MGGIHSTGVITRGRSSSASMCLSRSIFERAKFLRMQAMPIVTWKQHAPGVTFSIYRSGSRCVLAGTNLLNRRKAFISITTGLITEESVNVIDVHCAGQKILTSMICGFRGTNRDGSSVFTNQLLLLRVSALFRYLQLHVLLFYSFLIDNHMQIGE